MLFGEKYPDVVRMVSMGNFSRELCGGTHLESTAQVGLLKIVAEESVAAGTRRITALTGPAALEHVRRYEEALIRTAALVKAPPLQVRERVESLLEEVRKLRKKKVAAGRIEQTLPGLTSSGTATVSDPVQALLENAPDIKGAKIVVAGLSGVDPGQMRQLIDQLRRKAAPVAVMLRTRGDEGKVALIAGLSRDLVEKGLDAVQWIRPVAKVVGGGGGGRADMAQAGGKLPDKLPEALDTARSEIEAMLGTTG